MTRYHINKELSIFAHKNISVHDNNLFCIMTILLVLITASQQFQSLNSIANTPNSDTVFYRLNPSIKGIQAQIWNLSLNFFRKKKKKLSKCKCYISVDETYDSYSGKLCCVA